MDQDLDAVRALLPDENLRVVERIKAGDRTTVRRIEAVDSHDRSRSLVVKRYHGEDEGWLRETAALDSVPGAVRVPAVVAIGTDPPMLVMEDLGGGPSLADDLLGDDAAAATDALIGWAEALADLHCATRDSRGAFTAGLAQRGGGTSVAESLMPTRLRDAERVLDLGCGSLGVRIPAGSLDELTGLIARLGGDTTAALTPADTCPDNNVRIGQRRVLIDFESAQWNHLAWDVAYLEVPWPTCWCAWRIPEDVAGAAIARYRAIAADAFPVVAEDSFTRDIEAATAGWALMTAAWFLDRALEGADPDQQADPGHPTPTRRAVVLHRLDRAAGSAELPALAELAGGLRAALHERWGDVPLDVAPAFRSR